MRRISAASALGLVVSAAILSAATPEDAAAIRRASVFVAPDGSDARSCRSRAAACRSFNRAYRAARPGQVVEVAGGRYPLQQILRDPRKKSTRKVVFRPARRAAVVLDKLVLGDHHPSLSPRNLVIRSMRTSYATPADQLPMIAYPGTRNVVWKNLDAGNFHLWGVQNFKVLGGDWGPCSISGSLNCLNSKIDAGPAGYTTRNVLVDGALFHDYRFSPSCYEPGAACHFECMYVNAGHGITIRRTRFRDCALYNIFVTISGPDGAAVGHRNLKIENNWFGAPWDENPTDPPQRRRWSAVSLAWCENSPHGYRNVRVRFNSFHPTTGLELGGSPTCTFDRIRVTGNMLIYPGSCESRARYAYNLWSTVWGRGKCGRTDRILGKGFPYVRSTNTRGFNFHLRRNRATKADNFVPVSASGGCPARDFDRQRRPMQKRCDAGSDERRLRRR